MFYNSGNGFKASTEKSMTPVTGLYVFGFCGFLHRANPTKATCVKMVLGETMVSSNLLDRASDSYSGHWPGETGSMQAVVQLWKGGGRWCWSTTPPTTSGGGPLPLAPPSCSRTASVFVHTITPILLVCRSGRRVGMS